MCSTLIYNAEIVNEGHSFHGYVMTEGPFIVKTGSMDSLPAPGGHSLDALKGMADVSIDCKGQTLIPGAIDTHVHFRDPGLTEKGDMATESRAAVAGGVTSFIDMPNTKPVTDSMEAVEMKNKRAREVSLANYGFFIGATNSNAEELLDADYSQVAGIKLFLGSSTGNMLVDDVETLSKIFKNARSVIAVHAEDESIIRQSRENLLSEHHGTIPVERHPDLRPRQACIKATRKAIELARLTGARLHICHISTADELQIIKEAKADGVKVTAETCPQYLIFDRNDFMSLGSRIKCNPSIKDPSDRIALVREIREDGCIDTIATDHAPHLPSQKEGDALTAASGMPMVQFSLRTMLELWRSEPQLDGTGIEHIVDLMCHRPAQIFGIDRRGYIRNGYYADLVLVNRNDNGTSHKISDKDTTSRCGWTPLIGRALPDRIVFTMVNGNIVYDSGGFHPGKAMPLHFGYHSNTQK